MSSAAAPPPSRPVRSPHRSPAPRRRARGVRLHSGAGARGHQLHVAAGRGSAGRTAAQRAHHSLSPAAATTPSRTRLGFMRRLRGLYRRLSARPVRRRSSAHPGRDKGDDRARRPATPLVLGPYVPDWVPSQVRHAAEAGGPRCETRTAGRPAIDRHDRTAVQPGRRGEGVSPAGRGLQLHELPLGVDAQIWRPLRNSPTGPAVAGQSRQSKGCSCRPRCLLSDLSELPGARLLIAGGGPERDLLERRVEHALPRASRAPGTARPDRSRGCHAGLRGVLPAGLRRRQPADRVGGNGLRQARGGDRGRWPAPRRVR